MERPGCTQRSVPKVVPASPALRSRAARAVPSRAVADAPLRYAPQSSPVLQAVPKPNADPRPTARLLRPSSQPVLATMQGPTRNQLKSPGNRPARTMIYTGSVVAGEPPDEFQKHCGSSARTQSPQDVVQVAKARPVTEVRVHHYVPATRQLRRATSRTELRLRQSTSTHCLACGASAGSVVAAPVAIGRSASSVGSASAPSPSFETQSFLPVSWHGSVTPRTPCTTLRASRSQPSLLRHPVGTRPAATSSPKSRPIRMARSIEPDPGTAAHTRSTSASSKAEKWDSESCRTSRRHESSTSPDRQGDSTSPSLRKGIEASPSSSAPAPYLQAQDWDPQHALLIGSIQLIFGAFGVPPPPLDPSTLCVLVRDFEMNHPELTASWTSNPRWCEQCARHVCTLLFDVLCGERTLVPVAPGTNVPVAITWDKQGGVAEDWPSDYAPSVDKIRGILDSWDDDGHRRRIARVFQKSNPDAAGKIWWHTGHIQHFSRLLFEEFGLPLPQFPEPVWYQFARDCDSAIVASLDETRALEFGRHVLNRILSFHQSVDVAGTTTEECRASPAMSKEVADQLGMATAMDPRSKQYARALLDAMFNLHLTPQAKAKAKAPRSSCRAEQASPAGPKSSLDGSTRTLSPPIQGSLAAENSSSGTPAASQTLAETVTVPSTGESCSTSKGANQSRWACGRSQVQALKENIELDSTLPTVGTKVASTDSDRPRVDAGTVSSDEPSVSSEACRGIFEGVRLRSEVSHRALPAVATDEIATADGPTSVPSLAKSQEGCGNRWRRSDLRTPLGPRAVQGEAQQLEEENELMRALSRRRRVIEEKGAHYTKENSSCTADRPDVKLESATCSKLTGTAVVESALNSLHTARTSLRDCEHPSAVSEADILGHGLTAVGDSASKIQPQQPARVSNGGKHQFNDDEIEGSNFLPGDAASPSVEIDSDVPELLAMVQATCSSLAESLKARLPLNSRKAKARCSWEQPSPPQSHAQYCAELPPSAVVAAAAAARELLTEVEQAFLPGTPVDTTAPAAEPGNMTQWFNMSTPTGGRFDLDASVLSGQRGTGPKRHRHSWPAGKFAGLAADICNESSSECSEGNGEGMGSLKADGHACSRRRAMPTTGQGGSLGEWLEELRRVDPCPLIRPPRVLAPMSPRE